MGPAAAAAAAIQRQLNARPVLLEQTLPQHLLACSLPQGLARCRGTQQRAQVQVPQDVLQQGHWHEQLAGLRARRGWLRGLLRVLLRVWLLLLCSLLLQVLRLGLLGLLLQNRHSCATACCSAAFLRHHCLWWVGWAAGGWLIVHVGRLMGAGPAPLVCWLLLLLWPVLLVRASWLCEHLPEVAVDCSRQGKGGDMEAHLV
jgi:hypothetical protein